MVLEYYGRRVSQARLARLARTTLREGTSVQNLARAARHLGFDAAWRERSTIAELRSYFQRGIPTIVSWFSSDEGHYSVVVGLTRRTITLADPELGRFRTLPLATFLRVWFTLKRDPPRSGRDFFLRRLIIVRLRK